jgi:hypothetical protein
MEAGRPRRTLDVARRVAGAAITGVGCRLRPHLRSRVAPTPACVLGAHVRPARGVLCRALGCRMRLANAPRACRGHEQTESIHGS